MKPHLNTGILFWPAYLKTDRIRLVRVQHEKQRLINEETGLKYQERKK